ncbi:hypothetical protein B0H17DRAFT_1212622 [Mycena rosella]|uniref:Uncharacterized protein n=1 Tax=Mycena rosella TaxID=1033263 RepID=A0AAD7CRE7_MYCRO|nr:hypothetical protein B0H17DRAFT_1212622 [Mycena rosella]
MGSGCLPHPQPKTLPQWPCCKVPDTGSRAHAPCTHPHPPYSTTTAPPATPPTPSCSTLTSTTPPPGSPSPPRAAIFDLSTLDLEHLAFDCDSGNESGSDDGYVSTLQRMQRALPPATAPARRVARVVSALRAPRALLAMEVEVENASVSASTSASTMTEGRLGSTPEGEVFQSITVIPGFESTGFEELRLETPSLRRSSSPRLQCPVLRLGSGRRVRRCGDEFLEGCHPNFVPYKVAHTLRYIARVSAPRVEIHQSHQTRLANGMHNVLNPEKPELLEAVIGCQIFDLYYAGLPDPTTNASEPHRHA